MIISQDTLTERQRCATIAQQLADEWRQDGLITEAHAGYAIVRLILTTPNIDLGYPQPDIGTQGRS